MDLLRMRGSGSQRKLNSTMGSFEGGHRKGNSSTENTKFGLSQQPAESEQTEYEVFQQYDKEFSAVLAQLHKLQDTNELKELSENGVKELCSKITLLVFDWQKQTSENQEVFCRESLLQGLVSLLFRLTNLRIRLRIIKSIIQLFRAIGLHKPFEYLQQEETTERNQGSNVAKIENGIISGQDYVELLQSVLKEVFNYSKDKKYTAILGEEGIFSEILESVSSVKCCMATDYSSLVGLDILSLFVQILKNLANEDTLRIRFFEKRAIGISTAFLHHFVLPNEEDINEREQKIIKIYSQITALLRNLAVDINCTRVFLEFGVIDKLCMSIEKFSSEQNELMLNTMRILSKISLDKECSLRIFQNTSAIQNLCQFFKLYKTNIFIIIRIAFIFANITTYNETIRTLIYFQFNAFKDIYNCFEYYAAREITPQKNDTIDRLGLSTTAWDFKAMQKESDSEALIKLVRLIANLLTVSEIGNNLVLKKSVYYQDLVKKTKQLLCKQRELGETNKEMVVCLLSCLANVTFYEKQATVLTSDFESKNNQSELVIMVSMYIMESKEAEEDVQCEALRVLSNLSRSKELTKQILKCRLLEAVVLLLDSNSKDIVYYAIGTLINLTNNDEIKRTIENSTMESLLQIVEDCTLDDNDLVQITLKCIGNIMENNNKIQQDFMQKIEAALMKYGEECDLVISRTERENTEISDILALRGIINQILNSMPEEMYGCQVPNCGRKFKEQSEYIKHMQRRHNL